MSLFFDEEIEKVKAHLDEAAQKELLRQDPRTDGTWQDRKNSSDRVHLYKTHSSNRHYF